MSMYAPANNAPLVSYTHLMICHVSLLVHQVVTMTMGCVSSAMPPALLASHPPLTALVVLVVTLSNPTEALACVAVLRRCPLRVATAHLPLSNACLSVTPSPFIHLSHFSTRRMGITQLLSCRRR